MWRLSGGIPGEALQKNDKSGFQRAENRKEGFSVFLKGNYQDELI